MLPDGGRVVTNFIVQALNGEVLTLYGDGSRTHSFCFIVRPTEVQGVDAAHFAHLDGHHGLEGILC